MNVSINQQRIWKVICDPRSWAYSAAFDGASNRGDAYIDVRLRLAAKGGIYSVHGLAIPIQDTYIGKCVHQIVEQSLEGVLDTVRKEILLSIATDGTRNMTCRLSGAVTRFKLDAHPGFFLVWCAAHQLDLDVQRLMSRLLQEEFRSPLNALIAYLLRRQYTLR